MENFNKLRTWNKISLIALANLGLTISCIQGSQAQDTPFICTTDQENTPTTYAQKDNGSIPVFKWQNTSFPPPYTPEVRCQKVTERLNNFKAQGVPLKNFQTGQVNGENVICVDSCAPDGSNLLFTLGKDQDPKKVLEALIQSSQGAGALVQHTNCGTRLTDNPDGTVTFDLDAHICQTEAEETW